MRNSIWVFLAMTSAVTLQGCAHSAENKRVDNEVAQENSVKSRADLSTEAGQLIQNSPGLTAEQRSKLSALRDSTRAKIDEIASESLRLRSVLIKDLISTNYNANEVELIENRMKKAEDKRLSVTFNAVEQANTILGHDVTPNREQIMDDLFQGHGSRD